MHRLFKQGLVVASAIIAIAVSGTIAVAISTIAAFGLSSLELIMMIRIMISPTFARVSYRYIQFQDYDYQIVPTGTATESGIKV